MKYETNPIICEGDGPFAQFRQWYSRYFAKPEGGPNLRAVG